MFSDKNFMFIADIYHECDVTPARVLNENDADDEQ
jgi:hypothetical protein